MAGAGLGLGKDSLEVGWVSRLLGVDEDEVEGFLRFEVRKTVLLVSQGQYCCV